MRRKLRDGKVRHRAARKRRVQKKLEWSKRTRLTVFRSNRHIYAQLVESESGRTITTISTRKPGLIDGGVSTGGIEAAKGVGAALAEFAKQNGIDEVVFHRNGFRYHGRVKALADGAREGGLRF